MPSLQHPSDSKPHHEYWRVLYPQYGTPGSTAHSYGKWKTVMECDGLFGARERLRMAWYAEHPGRDRPPHLTAVTTYVASPVRSLTAKVCLSCLWVSRDLEAEHPEMNDQRIVETVPTGRNRDALNGPVPPAPTSRMPPRAARR